MNDCYSAYPRPTIHNDSPCRKKVCGGDSDVIFALIFGIGHGVLYKVNLEVKRNKRRDKYVLSTF